MTSRDLSHRVESPAAERLRLVAHAFLALRVEGRASRVYINEIAEAISNGMLLAAMELSTTLLEIWVRDLLVIRKLTQKNPKTKHQIRWLLTKIDRETEGLSRGQMFAPMCKELLDLAVIDAEELEWLESFYKRVRTPLHHGISGRMVDPDGQAGDMLSTATTNEQMFLASIFGSAPHKRADQLEDYVYAFAPGILEECVNFLAAHQIPRVGV